MKFPFEIDMTAYFAVTDGQGILPIRMELIDIDEDRPAVFDATAEFRFDDNFMNFVNVIRLRAAIESLSFAGI